MSYLLVGGGQVGACLHQHWDKACMVVASSPYQWRVSILLCQKVLLATCCMHTEPA